MSTRRAFGTDSYTPMTCAPHTKNIQKQTRNTSKTKPQTTSRELHRSETQNAQHARALTHIDAHHTTPRLHFAPTRQEKDWRVNDHVRAKAKIRIGEKGTNTEVGKLQRQKSEVCSTSSGQGGHSSFGLGPVLRASKHRSGSSGVTPRESHTCTRVTPLNKRRTAGVSCR